MKHIFFLLVAFILLFMTASCSSDDNSEETVTTENKYNFSFSVMAVDINGNNLLSGIKSDDCYYIDDVSIKPLQENDNVTLETIDDRNLYSADFDAVDTKLLVSVDSYGFDGTITHQFVIQLNKNNNIITDTISFEIEKNQNNILCKNIFVNNTLKLLADNSFPQTIHIVKIAPSVYDQLEKNNNETLIEKEVDGLKFSFWLSDMDDKTTNIFDKKDIGERGFKFNMLLTNNSDQNIYIDNSNIGPYLSNVFDIDNNYKGRSCVRFPQILALYKIQPGETHYESLSWCSYDLNIPDNTQLPAGKYYTYFGKNITYESGDNYDILDHTKTNTTRKTVKIPHMLINFEVK